jgi:hypothetical protein
MNSIIVPKAKLPRNSKIIPVGWLEVEALVGIPAAFFQKL